MPGEISFFDNHLEKLMCRRKKKAPLRAEEEKKTTKDGMLRIIGLREPLPRTRRKQ